MKKKLFNLRTYFFNDQNKRLNLQIPEKKPMNKIKYF